MSFISLLPSDQERNNVMKATMRLAGALFGVLLFVYSTNLLHLGGDTASAQNNNNRIRIMPLGDSITYDNNIGDTRPEGLRTGYRQPLYLSLVEAGYHVDFVGSQVAGQDAVPEFDPDNEGHPGWTDAQIAANVYNWLQSSPAEIILLHIGTNMLDTSPNDVENILDEIDRYESDTGKVITVFLARIINRGNHVCPNSSETTTFNVNVEVMARNRIARGDRITIVDMECGAGIDYQQDTAPPYEHDMYDTLHPNDAGYKKMADAWKKALDEVIISTPKPPSNLRFN